MTHFISRRLLVAGRRFVLPVLAVLGLSMVPALPASAATFTTIAYFGGNSVGDGAQPLSGVIADQNGVLFGTTEFGGGTYACKPRESGCGTVYSLTPDKRDYHERVLYAFEGFSDGSYPIGGLALQNGVLFGTTSTGSGSAKYGTVFALTPKGSGYAKTTLYSFKGLAKADGAQPQSQLIADSNGDLFGTTNAGGQGCAGTGCGTVYELARNGSNYTEHVLYAFNETVSNGGSTPNAGLVRDNQGVLYGTTVIGGIAGFCTYGCGMVYSLTPKGGFQYQLTILYSFQGGADGELPYARLRLGRGGTIVGTTLGGGFACHGGIGCGTVFELTPGSSGYSEQVLYRFQGGLDGANPATRIVIDNKSILYGTTRGTACNCATVYQLIPAKSGYRNQVLQSLNESGVPNGDLISDKTGSLFGTTYSAYGSRGGFGTVFEVTP